MGEAQRPYSVVIAVDVSEATDVVLQHGLDAASRRGPADIHVISVVPTGRGLFHRTRSHEAEIEEVEADLRPRIADVVTAFADTVDDVDQWHVRLHVRAGEPAEEIVDLIDETRADLVVMGRHGEAARRRGMLGPVPDRVTRWGRCSSLIVQPTDYEPAELASDVPCPECVLTRRESDGENWFCARHHGNARVRGASVGPGASLKPGGLF